MNWKTLQTDLEFCLCPAGEGVATVHTGIEKKSKLQAFLYSHDVNEVHTLWREQFNQLPNSDAPLLLGIPSDCGGGILRGSNWGPLYIREYLYQHYQPQCLDLGDIRVVPHLLHDNYLNEKTIASVRKALYMDARIDLPVSPLSITEKICRDIHDVFPQKAIVALGGDHSIAYPLLKSYLQAKQKQSRRVGVIQIDAHTDLLPSRLGIDINFATWASKILKDLPAPDHLVQLGIRSTQKTKEYWEDTFGVKQFWAVDVQQQGMPAIASAIVDHFQQREIDELYITVDIDGIDGNYAAATGTPEYDGLLPQDVYACLAVLSEKFQITGADIAEVAPFISNAIPSTEPQPETTLSIAAAITHQLLNACE